MNARYFSAFLVLMIAVVGALRISLTPDFALFELALASLLALLGAAALAHVNSRSQSAILMPLFFAASLAYAAFIYLTGNYNQPGYILISFVVLSLLGMVLTFGRAEPLRESRRSRSRAAPPGEPSGKQAMRPARMQSAVLDKQPASQQRSAVRRNLRDRGQATGGTGGTSGTQKSSDNGGSQKKDAMKEHLVSRSQQQRKQQRSSSSSSAPVHSKRRSTKPRKRKVNVSKK